MKDKRKIIAFLLAVVMMIMLLPMPANAVDGDSDDDGYYDYEVDKLRTFLEQPSVNVGEKNGEKISTSYASDNPGTWDGIVWGTTNPKRVNEINNWYSKSLSGNLDLSGFTELTVLSISENEIEAIDVSEALALKKLSIYGNGLASLNISGAQALTRIEGSNNNLVSLDLSDSISLEYLNVENNQLENLDLSKAIPLRELFCANNQLESLNLNGVTNIEYIDCNTNKLISLDLRNMSNLWFLDCSDNKLQNLTLNNVNNIENLDCQNNKLTSLDLEHLTKLEDLYCHTNELTRLDASDSVLSSIYCDSNPLIKIKANIMYGDEVKNISITAAGNGYIDLYFGEFLGAFATPHSDSVFVKWLKDGNEVQGDNAEYNDFDLGNDYDLIAVFSTATVSFDFHNGSEVEEVIVNIGDKVSEPNKPTREGYIFGGWYRNTDYTERWDFEKDVVASNITLFAKWLEEPGESEEPVEPVDQIVKINLPDKHTMYVGGRVTWDPKAEEGTWVWNNEYLTSVSNSPRTFKALKEGVTTVTYTLNNQSHNIEVTIKATELPKTGQDYSQMKVLGILGIFAGCIALLIGSRKKQKRIN